jgi:hypothetical protein
VSDSTTESTTTATSHDATAAPPDRALRRSQIVVAWTLFGLAVIAPLIDAPALWPLSALGASVTGLTLWGALGHESVAAPVVGLIVTALPMMYAADRPAVGSLAAVVLALALGEHLATSRHSASVTPGTARRWVGPAATLLHGGVALAAVVVAMMLTALPEARAESLTAIAALGIAAFALQRRRARMADVPLPAPTRLS